MHGTFWRILYTILSGRKEKDSNFGNLLRQANRLKTNKKPRPKQSGLDMTNTLSLRNETTFQICDGSMPDPVFAVHLKICQRIHFFDSIARYSQNSITHAINLFWQ
jgi:hypothetical protein